MRLMTRLLRIIDRSVFECAVCGGISRGGTPRVPGGWACSGDCWDEALLKHYVDSRPKT